MVDRQTSWTDDDVAAIRKQLDRMLSSESFSHASRQSRFLSYIVEATISGQADRLSQFAVGVDVFDRDASFDPVSDSSVRVEAGRLRSKLLEYYAGSGSSDPIVISLPKGGYRVDIKMKVGADIKQSKSNRIVLFGILVVGAVVLALVMMALERPRDALPGNARPQATADLSRCAEDDLRRQVDRPAVAILPFDNMSADPEQEYFSDGITEDIITDLSIVSGLTVISRHSTFVYKDRAISARDVGENLCARYVLEGSVRKVGNQLRITAQLIDALTDSHVWAERYDRVFDDVFAIQGEVSRMIVGALRIELTDQEQRRLGHVGTDNVTAHDLYLRARERFYLFTTDDIYEALRLFSESIALDPLYAEAYAWKSRVLVYLFITGVNNANDETVIPAIEFARTAIELDELLPMAHANLGWALRWNHEMDAAIAEVRRATALDNSFADAHLWLSMIMSSAWRGQEALKSIQEGIRVNPNYSVTYILALGRANLVLGRNERALAQFERGVARNPHFLPNHVYRIFALEALGRMDDAETARDDLRQNFPDFEFSAAYLFFLDERPE